MLATMRQSIALRLKCLDLALKAKAHGDQRPPREIAAEFLAWASSEPQAPVEEPAPAQLAGGSSDDLHNFTMRTWLATPPTLVGNSFLVGGNFTTHGAFKPQPRLTIKDAVLAVLRERRRGLTALQLLRLLRARFMPELERTSLSPQLSRLAADNLIERKEGIYRLVETNAPLAVTSGASSSEGGTAP